MGIVNSCPLFEIHGRGWIVSFLLDDYRGRDGVELVYGIALSWGWRMFLLLDPL